MSKSFQGTQHNPYSSPASSTSIPEAERAIPAGNNDPFPYYLPITRFALAILGCWAFLIGSTEALDNLIVFFIDFRGYGWKQSYVVGRFIGMSFYALLGLYLMISGKWFSDRFFVKTVPSEESSEA